MTRLAIIFSLLFATPAWAETRAIKCLRDTTVTFWKYEKNTFTDDKCYYREDGQWKSPEYWTAEDWACHNYDLPHGTEEGQKLFKAMVDFIALTIRQDSFYVEDGTCELVELPD